MLARSAVVVAVVVIALVAGAGSALAHVEPEPASVRPGEPATVGFTPEHGCVDSPHIEMRFQIPNGLDDVAGQPKAGWRIEMPPDQIVFTGGSMPADATTAFGLRFTAPDTPGRDVTFKVVQVCAEGIERWIEVPTPDAPEPEFPAPVVRVLGEGQPAADTETNSHSDDDGLSTGALVAIVAGAVIVIGGGASVVVLRRRARAARTGTDTSAT